MNSTQGPSYTVRRWSGLRQVVFEVVPVLGVGVLFGVLEGRWVLGAVLGAVVLVLAALALDRATLAFRVDQSGITWSRPVPRVVLSHAGVRRLDWGSVHDLEVVEGEVVRARLRADAPLPGWMTARVVEPGGELGTVEGEAPGVEGQKVQDVAKRLAPEVMVTCRVGRS